MAATLESVEEKAKDKQIIFRFLDETEHYKLVDIFEEYKGDVPNPALSRVAIAEVETECINCRAFGRVFNNHGTSDECYVCLGSKKVTEIIAFFVYQLIPHAEPMYVKEEYRNSKIWLKLASMIAPLADKKDTYIIASTENVENMCNALGLERLQKPVYVKRVSHKIFNEEG